MSKTNQDSQYERGVKDGLNGDVLDDVVQNLSKEGSVYDKGYYYGQEHRHDRKEKTTSSDSLVTQNKDTKDRSESKSPQSHSYSAGSYSSPIGSNLIIIIGFLLFIAYIIIFGICIPFFESNFVQPSLPYISTIGYYTRGGENGSLCIPTNIAVDPSGNLYVDDLGNNRIEKFSPDGKYLNQWKILEAASWGHSLATDSQGSLYVMNIWARAEIKKFSSDGRLISSWKAEDGAIQMTRDSSGDFFLLFQKYDPRKNRSYGIIRRYSANGFEKNHWEVDYQIKKIALDPSRDILYAINFGTETVEKYSKSGNSLGTLLKVGNGIVSSDYPIDIAVDSTGNIYTLEASTKRIQKFSSSGAILGVWNSGQNFNPSFEKPVAITVDTQGNIYIADYNKNCIHKLSQQL
ncbi:MAG: hypothetical protein LUQ31_01245 [Methanoregula sp.]|nr:hypothetical protein [Methanoregula sp.]